MHTGSPGDGPDRGTRYSITLPEGVANIAKRCEKLVFQALKSHNLSYNYLSVFHVEPRGTSFLVGFTVGLVSGQEIFIYVEPNFPIPGAELKNRGGSGNQSVTTWQFPFDPKLQSLGSVVNTDPLGILFSRLNLAWVPSEVDLLAYRPGRRAMVRCSDESKTAFVKAVRPRAARRIVSAARLALSSDVPTPNVIGWSPAGIAIYEKANGIELSGAHGSGVTAPVAINAAFEALSKLDRVETEVPSRRPIIDNFSWYLARANQAHLAEKTRLKKLEAKIQALKQGSRGSGEVTTIHGDLHLGQLFVSEDKQRSLSGIIDLDDMGLGLVVDDVAGMWANCIASMHLSDVENESTYWRECIQVLESWRLPLKTDLSRLHSSIAVHLVAQTLSTRGLNPAVAHALIRDATRQLD